MGRYSANEIITLIIIPNHTASSLMTPHETHLRMRPTFKPKPYCWLIITPSLRGCNAPLLDLTRNDAPPTPQFAVLPPNLDFSPTHVFETLTRQDGAQVRSAPSPRQRLQP